MSIQTELTRLTNAKAAIKAAIEGKGVAVPDATLLDGMSALIESIDAGGGGGLSLEYNRLKPIAKGTITVAERTVVDDENRLIIEHNAGVIPFLFTITASKMSAQNDLEFIVTYRIPVSTSDTSSSCYSYSSRRSSSSSYRYTGRSREIESVSSSKWDEQYVSIVSSKVTLYLNTDITYSWTAFYIE